MRDVKRASPPDLTLHDAAVRAIQALFPLSCILGWNGAVSSVTTLGVSVLSGADGGTDYVTIQLGGRQGAV